MLETVVITTLDDAERYVRQIRLGPMMAVQVENPQPVFFVAGFFVGFGFSVFAYA